LSREAIFGAGVKGEREGNRGRRLFCKERISVPVRGEYRLAVD